MELYSKLKDFRLKKGFTQKQVAEAINIDTPTYAHYESGRRTPNAKTWVKICEFLDMPVFPTKIQVVYPENIIEDFKKCIENNGKTTNSYHENNRRYNEINMTLEKILAIRNEALGILDLVDDSPLLNQNYNNTAILNVDLDVRVEMLIEDALKHMTILINENAKLI